MGALSDFSDTLDAGFSERVVSVSAATLHIAEARPKPFADAMLDVIVKGNGDITAALTHEMVNTPAASIPRLYNYSREATYDTMPTGNTIDHRNIDKSLIDAILLTELGSDPLYKVTGAIGIKISPSNAALPHLITVRNYDPLTKEIAVYPPELIWKKYENFDVDAANKKVKVWKCLVGSNGTSLRITYELYLERNSVYVLEPYTYTETIPYPDAANITWGEDYILAFYREADPTGLILSGPDIPWLYRLSSNTYPQLALPTAPAADATYLPVIKLRHRGTDLTANKNSQSYIAAKNFTRQAHINLEDLVANLNANKDIGEVDHAFLMYGINIQTEVPESLLYLHKFFASLYDTQTSNEILYKASLGETGYGMAPVNTLDSFLGVTKGSFAENGLKLRFSFDYIKSITSVGTVGNGRIGNISRTFIEDAAEQILIGHYYDPVSNTSVPKYINNTKGAIILIKQVDVNIIHKIEVYGLACTSNIYKDKFLYTTMLDVIQNTEENNLIIPLQYELAQSFPLKTRGNLYRDSLLLVLNSFQVTKLHWYQTEEFKYVMIGLGVALSIAAIIYQAPYLIAAIKAGVWALIYFVMIQVVISMTITLASRFIVKEYGEDIGIIATVLLVITAAVLTKGSATSASKDFLLASAAYVMQGAMAIVSSANEFLVEKGQEIVAEYEEFLSLYDNATKELEETKDLLKNKSDVNPLLFASPERFRIVPNESPDAFYQRCLGLPDNTMHTIHNEIPTFFTERLKLPRTVPAELFA